MMPTNTLNPMAIGKACAKGTPAFNCTSIRTIDTDIDIDIDIEATIDRPIPRPRMVIAMPRPRMPSTDTLCTMAATLPADKNPGTKIEKTPKTIKAITRMICSWPSLPRLPPPDIPGLAHDLMHQQHIDNPPHAPKPNGLDLRLESVKVSDRSLLISSLSLCVTSARWTWHKEAGLETVTEIAVRLQPGVLTADVLCAALFRQFNGSIRVQKEHVAVTNLVKIIHAALDIGSRKGFHSTTSRELAQVPKRAG